MVSDYGYPMEKFFYETDDMYINCVHRIKGKRGTKIEAEVTQKPVVIYQHGWIDSAAGICCDGLQSIAFQFAEAGFDLWMNNSRGNRFSKHHRYLDPTFDVSYWDFTFQ